MQTRIGTLQEQAASYAEMVSCLIRSGFLLSSQHWSNAPSAPHRVVVSSSKLVDIISGL